MCLQRHVSLTGIKGGSSRRLSDQFAQSVTSNKSSPQNLTLFGNKCGITPRGRNLRLTSVFGSQLVTQKHNILTLSPSFLPTMQVSRYMLTARDNLITRAQDPFHQLRSGERHKILWRAPALFETMPFITNSLQPRWRRNEFLPNKGNYNRKASENLAML